MARQVSMEAALAAFERKCAELLRANILLEAAAAERDAELEQLRVENARLHEQHADATEPEEAPAAEPTPPVTRRRSPRT